MALEMNTLAGFMRLGPQVYPERPNAVQVIQRGPHGKRLSADPVAVRAGMPRGSGFRFWVEQLNVPADESWNPPQEVVGLMGLGDLSRSAKVMLTEKVKTLTKASMSGVADPKLVREKAEELRQEVLSYPRWDDSSWGLPFTDDYESRHTLIVWINQASLRARNKLDVQADEKARVAKEALDPKVADTSTARVLKDTAAAYPEAVQERAEEMFGGKGDGFCSSEQLRVPVFGPMFCKKKGEPRFKNPAVTVALFAGGAILLYGFAQGLGASIARR